MSNKKFILHIGFPEDNRIKNINNLYKVENLKEILHSTEKEIHIHAPLKLKTRRDLYQTLKRNTDQPILSILYPMTYPEFEETYLSEHQLDAEIDTNKIKDEYSRMQPPVKTVDCDEIDLPENQESLYDAIKNYKQKYPNSDQHDSKYHKETISEHIILVAEEIVKIIIQNQYKSNKLNNILYNATLYHDLGKYWTKRYDKDKNETNFNNHENVSAVIFVSEMILFQKECESYISDFQKWSLHPDSFNTKLSFYNDIHTYFDEFVKTTTQIILNHMFIKKKPVSEKALKRRQLTDDEIDYLLVFSVADDKGRVI